MKTSLCLVSGVAAMAAASMAMADPVVANAACELTGLQKAAGYVTFSNIVMFICAVGGALFTGILLMHLRGLFKMIPLALYKAAGYAGVAALCTSGSWMGAQNAPYGQFVGAALGAGALAVLLGDLADLFGWEKKGQTVWHASVMVLGGSLVLTQANPMVGGVAVLGLMGLLGFSAFSAPGMVAMWFDSKDSLWKATFAALAVLIPSALYRSTLARCTAWKCFGQRSVGYARWWPSSPFQQSRYKWFINGFRLEATPAL